MTKLLVQALISFVFVINISASNAVAEKTGPENIYMPNRAQYHTDHYSGQQTHNAACALCNKCQGTDEEHFVIARSTNFIVVLNRFPYSKGHLLIIPLQHEGKLENFSVAHLHELMDLTQRCVPYLKELLGCEGINVGVNLGKAAGASIEDHLHVHLVPRYDKEKDNFLHVIAQTRAMPYNFKNLYEELKSKSAPLSLKDAK